MNVHLLTGLKGFGMGAANVIPGVSGGTIALLTGIYSEIVDSINSLTEISVWKTLFKGHFKEFWHLIHGPFLLSLGIGIIASIFTLAKLMTYVLGAFPIQTWAFFFGLIVASAVIMFRSLGRWDWKDVVFTLTGIGLGVAVCTLSPTETPDSMLFLFFCGALAICTMILPGISGSFILLILGKYDFVMQAIAELDWPVLIVFGAGCLVGILAFAKFLHWLLARWERQTMLVLLGFILGSLVKVWPWQETAAGDELHIAGAVICCIAGVALVLGLELLSVRHAPSNTRR